MDTARDASAASDPSPGGAPARRRIAVVTGTRAEFGLLRPVMRAVHAHPALELAIIAAGSHLVPPAMTYREVKAFAQSLGLPIADSVPMQVAGRTGREDDAESVGRGVARFVRAFQGVRPDWVVVLGDRVEAFAAASAASIGGWGLAHVHGGDRAEGVADEAMRHAISKLAHVHLAATAQSGARLVRMGEDPAHVHVVGSPAIDELSGIPMLPSDQARALLGRAAGDAGGDAAGDRGHQVRAVVLLHPAGLAADEERALARSTFEGVALSSGNAPVLALEPNLDPGRDVVLDELRRAAAAHGWLVRDHLPRASFIGLLKRLRADSGGGPGVLVGNSSAGLIECAALGVPVVNIGPRQGGRERAGNVVDVLCGPGAGAASGVGADGAGAAAQVAQAVRAAQASPPPAPDGRFGAGDAGVRIAGVLAGDDPHVPGRLRKRCAY